MSNIFRVVQKKSAKYFRLPLSFWLRSTIFLACILLIYTAVFVDQTAVFKNTVSATQAAPSTCDWSAQDYDDFYTPPVHDYTVEQVGEIVRVEHIQSYSKLDVGDVANLPDASLYGAEAYRILYVSQTPQEEAIIVSGLIVVPTGEIPDGGFPLLIHAHATTGLADQCAPSSREIDIKGLLHWIARGYIVAASDYPGLGLPGIHHYGVGDLAGYSVLDSGRAGLSFCDTERDIDMSTTNQIILEGHSQGGQAALFAHEFSTSYAPELNIVGTVLFAPAAEFRDLARQTANAEWSVRISPLVLAMYAYRDYYGTPANLDAWLQSPYASDVPTMAENKCIAGFAGWIGFQPENVFDPDLLTAIRNESWETIEPWSTYLSQNTPGNFSMDIPLLILQGEQDTLIDVGSTQKLTQRLCAQQNAVEFRRYKTAGHASIVPQGREYALQWMTHRLNGQPIESLCQIEPEDKFQRPSEPIILNGSQIDKLNGALLTDLVVYAYKDNQWVTIPHQIDEKNGTNQYVAFEDGVFDENDELLFMTDDAGSKPSAADFNHISLPASNSSRYEIELTDPLDLTQTGYVYIFESTEFVPFNNSNYVAFDPLKHRITGRTYSLGFPSFVPTINYLALGTGVNILDRTKVALDCNIPFVCPITEDNLSGPPNYEVIKDGPLRVILREGLVHGYGSMVMWQRPYTITQELAGDVKVSTDFNPAVTGATFFNSAVPQGVTIDGLPDSIPPVPVSSWWQVSTSEGTLIQVTDIEAIGGDATNYFLDNDTVDQEDTGDQKHFGDAGLQISDPNQHFVHKYVLYMLADRQPNIGERYTQYFANPMLVNTTWLTEIPLTPRVFLPLIFK